MTTKQKIIGKTKRVISLYLYLRQRDSTVEQLAKKFRVNERSIQRDIKLLKEAGADISKGDMGYYVSKKRGYK